MIRSTINVFRRLFGVFKHNYNTEHPPKKTNNDIKSTNVADEALQGEYITVSTGSSVCKDSRIGSYTFIGLNTLISKTVIGRYNSIANNVNIGHGEHPINFISTSSFVSPVTAEILTKSECVITHDVWICSGATIRRGVTLGIGCVVGANAFVNKDVPPYAVVGGVPAKIIKYRFTPEKINIILASKWWEKDLETALITVKNLERED